MSDFTSESSEALELYLEEKFRRAAEAKEQRENKNKNKGPQSSSET